LQVVLNWGISRGCAVIPKAVGKEHQQENIDIYGFKLT